MKNFFLTFQKSRTALLLVLLVVEVLILSLFSPYLLNISNLIQITQFGAVLILLALGESIVMLSGREGIDLSVGAALSLSGVFFGLAMKAGLGIPAAVVITLISGCILGAINGFLVSITKMPALIATLGTQYVFSSLALYLTNGIPISGFPDSFKFLSLESTLGIPNQILFVVIPVCIMVMILIYTTKFGRKVYLLGTNPEAARFAAINERKIRFEVYMIPGILAALGAIVTNSWLMTARADAGSGMELQAITVACLGGIAVEGGRGNLGAVIIGVLIITMMNSGLQIANVNSIWQLAVLGFVLLIAVIFNHIIGNIVPKSAKA
ncbi:MAG: ABC transporter permease [Flexilinea sp.]